MIQNDTIRTKKNFHSIESTLFLTLLNCKIRLYSYRKEREIVEPIGNRLLQTLIERIC